MRKLLVLFLAVLLAGCAARTDENVTDAVTEKGSQTSEQAPEQLPEQKDEVREPAAEKNTVEVVFSVEKLRSDPVPVLSVPYTVEETFSCGEYVFARCRTGDASRLSLLVTVDGVAYDLGAAYRRILPDEDGVSLYRVELTEIASPEPVYMLHTFEYMLVTTTYFTVRNGVPVVLYEMEHLQSNARQLDIDLDAEVETVCNHGGTTSVNEWLYEWDVAAGEVRVADLKDLLDCYSVVYNENTGRISADTRLENGWSCTEYLYRDDGLTKVETSVRYLQDLQG